MTDVVGDTVHRLDQSITDFKTFVAQRFGDQAVLMASWREADQRLLDERFKTQTTTLDAAFAAAEKARQEALSTAKDDAARTDARIKSVEDTISNASGHAAGAREVKTDAVATRMETLVTLGVIASLVGGFVGHFIH